MMQKSILALALAGTATLVHARPIRASLRTPPLARQAELRSAQWCRA